MIIQKSISRSLLIAFLAFFAASIFIASSPSVVYAAGCEENLSAKKTEECRDKFVEQCKKDFPGRKNICEQLTVNQINDCAGDGNKLKGNCFNGISSGLSGGSKSKDSASKVDCKDDFEKLNENNCGILNMIKLITNVLAGLAGTVIVIMTIVGGIQYSMAGAEPGRVQSAKGKIINAVLALFLLVFGYAVLQWLIPGGVI